MESSVWIIRYNEARFASVSSNLIISLRRLSIGVLLLFKNSSSKDSVSILYIAQVRTTTAIRHTKMIVTIINNNPRGISRAMSFCKVTNKYG